MITLKHLSRLKAADFRHDKKYAVISITDPNLSDAYLQDDPNRVGLLRLKFWDFDNYIPEGVEDKDKDFADRVAVFAYKHLVEEPVDLLMVHCEMGFSRSAGVGAALAYCIRQTDMHFYHQSCPNARIRRAVIQAWDRRYGR